jgi:hypothetical protein
VRAAGDLRPFVTLVGADVWRDNGGAEERIEVPNEPWCVDV